jgi:hypothetical protein
MRFDDIKRHLAPYAIYARRKTTVNHAFAAAIAPSDDFDPDVVKHAIRLLGQNPDEELRCVYCDARAETWDHVFATVRESVFSGAGHRVGNLLPCCKPCNSKKGNRGWDAFVTSQEAAGPLRDARVARIRHYLEAFFVVDAIPSALPEYARFLEIRDEVLRLMKEADIIAAGIRSKMKAANKAPEPTPMSVTDRADARSAPATVVAHL